MPRDDAKKVRSPFPSRKVRAGFTFVELCLGMVITSMVIGALSAFVLATSEAWQQGASTNPVGGGQTVATLPVIATLAATRLEGELRGVDCAGGCFPGSLTNSSGQQASLMLWKGDTNGDGIIAASELELIEYDAVSHALYKYLPTGSTPTPTYAEFSSSSWIATYKQSATQTVLARNVDGAHFYVQTPASSTQYPLVEYQLYFGRSGQTRTRYGAICLRAPTTASGQTLN